MADKKICERCANPICKGDGLCSPRFGVSLKEFRKEFRISLRAYSKETNRESTGVSAVERGVIKPHKNDYEAVCKMIDKYVDSETLRDAYKNRFKIALNEPNILPWDESAIIYPAFPSIGGKKPTKEEYDKIVEKINEKPNDT